MSLFPPESIQDYARDAVARFKKKHDRPSAEYRIPSDAGYDVRHPMAEMLRLQRLMESIAEADGRAFREISMGVIKITGVN